MEDKIIIKELLHRCYVGVTDLERSTKQRLLIDIEIYGDFREAAQEDDVRKTISYSDVYRGIKAFLEDKRFHLIEKIAEDIAHFILSKYPARKVLVRVKKFVLKGANYVGVEIVRIKD
jgi:FolB domain-containing protein